MSVPLWTIKADPQERNGLVQEAGGVAFAGNPRFIRDEVLERRIEPLVLNLPKDITGATLKVAVGKLDVAPTSGSFSLSYSGDSTNLTGLSYAIAFGALQTALNSNPGISGAGGCTVEGTTSLFTVTFNTNGARSLITANDTLLSPPSYVRVTRRQTGDGSTREIQLIQIFQRPFAYSEDWTPNGIGTVALTNPVVGDASTPARFKIAFSDVPYGGAVRFTWSVAQITRATLVANVGATHTERFDFSGCNASAIGGEFIDIYKADDSVLRFWFNENLTDTAPPAPANGVLVQVDFAAAGPPEQIASAFRAKIILQAEFSNTLSVLYSSKVVDVVRAAPGTRGQSVVNVVSAPPVRSLLTLGTDGPLAGRTLPLVDQFGSIGLYFTAGRTLSVPSEAAACKRQIPVPLTTNSTANQVATAYQTAADADPQLVATVANNVVTITDAFAGAREALTTSNATGCSVVVERVGRVAAASLNYLDDESEIASDLDDEFAVTKVDALTWILVATAAGAVPSPTATDESLAWPRFFTGTLRFDSVALEYAFANTTSSTLDAPLEVVIAYPGKEPECILQISSQVDRNLIRKTGLSTPIFTAPLTALDSITMLWGTTDYTGGTAGKLDALTTTTLAVPRMCGFVDTTGSLRFYRLRAGVDATSGTAIIRPVDFNAVTNAKVWESVL